MEGREERERRMDGREGDGPYLSHPSCAPAVQATYIYFGSLSPKSTVQCSTGATTMHGVKGRRSPKFLNPGRNVSGNEMPRYELATYKYLRCNISRAICGLNTQRRWKVFTECKPWSRPIIAYAASC